MLKATEERAHTRTHTHRKRRVLAAADIKKGSGSSCCEHRHTEKETESCWNRRTGSDGRSSLWTSAVQHRGPLAVDVSQQETLATPVRPANGKNQQDDPVTSTTSTRFI